MLAEIQSAIDRWQIAAGISRVVVAVSGGADSVALLHSLRLLWQSRGIELIAVHVEHGIRGDSSRGDAGFVTRLTDAWGIEFECVNVDVPAAARATGESIEMAARRLRYEALVKVARDRAAEAIGTGHTLDDQVETVFLRLGRGTGPRGIGGISPRSLIDGLWYLRPLLACRGDDLRAWLQREGIAWREDASNFDAQFLRNRVRTELTPVFADIFTDAGLDAIGRFASLMQEEQAWLADETAATLQRVKVGQDKALHTLDCGKMRELPLPLLRRTLLLWLQEAGLPAAHQTADLVERLIRLIGEPAHGTSEMPLGSLFTARRVYENLSLFRAEAAEETATLPLVELAAEGTTRAAGWGLAVTISPAVELVKFRRGDPFAVPQGVTVAAHKLAGRKLTLRPPQPGDSLRPHGGAGSRKLARLLIDRKIPRDQRQRIPVICCGSDIVWVPGIALAEEYAAAEDDDDPLSLLSLDVAGHIT